MMKKYINENTIFDVIYFLLGTCLLIYSFEVGIMGDYKHYINQWGLIFDGINPWSTDNTYGPMHVIIGYLVNIHILAPKIMFNFLILLANYFLIKDLVKNQQFHRNSYLYIFAIPANTLFFSLTIVHGMNDTFAAALISFAITARLRKHDFLTGAFLAVAALTKYYPIVMLPFFALDFNRYRWRILISGALIFLSAMFFSYLVWGDQMLSSLIYGGVRGASGFSIFLDLDRYIGNNYLNLLIKLNALIVLVSVIFIFVYSALIKISWLEASVLAYLAMIIVYKVGHSQFFLPWLFLLAYIPALNITRANILSYFFFPTIIYLSFYQFSMDLGTNLLGNRPFWIEYYAGFVSAPFLILPLISALIFLIIHKKRDKFNG